MHIRPSPGAPKEKLAHGIPHIVVWPRRGPQNTGGPEISIFSLTLGLRLNNISNVVNSGEKYLKVGEGRVR
jgi:hypothetical protein